MRNEIRREKLNGKKHNKLKIAFFTDTYLPNRDGVVVSLLNLKKELERRGHKVFVFTPSPYGEEGKEGDVFYFKSKEFPPYPDYKFSIPNFFEVEKEVKDLGIDVIHNHGVALTAWAALFCAKSLSLPSLTTFHTDISRATHYITENRLLSKLSKKLTWKYLGFLFPKFDVVMAPSLKSVNQLKRNSIKAIFLPNGIFVPKNIKHVPIKKRGNYLLHVGRVVKEKEISYVFPFIKKYNTERGNLKLVIAGKGPYLKTLIEISRKKGVHKYVDFLGFVSDKKLSFLYKNARALIFTSRFDTQGLVVLEALARGTPVLARRGTSGEEITKSLSLSFSGYEEFVKAYERVGSISPKECYNLALNYDIRRITTKLLFIYNSLLTKNKKRN